MNFYSSSTYNHLQNWKQPNVVCPYNRRLLNNKKEQAIWNANNLINLKKHYAEWKKTRFKRLHIVWLHLCYIRVTKLEYDRAQISSCQELGWEQNDWKSTKEFPYDGITFVLWILVVKILDLYTCVKNPHNYTYPPKSLYTI